MGFNGSQTKAGGAGDFNSRRNSDLSLAFTRKEENSKVEYSDLSRILWTDMKKNVTLREDDDKSPASPVVGSTAGNECQTSYSMKCILYP